MGQDENPREAGFGDDHVNLRLDAEPHVKERSETKGWAIRGDRHAQRKKLCGPTANRMTEGDVKNETMMGD